MCDGVAPTHLAALHVVAFEAAEEAADVIARVARLERFVEHLHARHLPCDHV